MRKINRWLQQRLVFDLEALIERIEVLREANDDESFKFALTEAKAEVNVAIECLTEKESLADA